MKQRVPPLRAALALVTSLLLVLSYFSPIQQALRQFPEQIHLTCGEETILYTGGLTLHGEGLNVSASQDETLGQSVSVTATESGTSELLLSLLGIPLRRTEVQIDPEKRLIPGGQALGVAMRTNGVLIVGLSDVTANACPARDGGLKAGDLLLRMNGESIARVSDLTDIIQRSGASPVQVEFSRDGETHQTTLTPILDASNGTARLGAWVRDSTAGIGTLSFYDPDTGRYGALGHAITDGDTGSILTVSKGNVLAADILAVQKGQRGTPGELKGSFLRNAVLGDIQKNTALGIYGQMSEPMENALYPDGLPIGLHSSIHTGPATILSTIDVSGVQAFTVEITHINQQNTQSSKNMVLHITDERLLEATGGIVQGMSGSPIIQDGKIIGAVTHVLVNDPTTGYGIFIENMLDAAG